MDVGAGIGGVARRADANDLTYDDERATRVAVIRGAVDALEVDRATTVGVGALTEDGDVGLVEPRCRDEGGAQAVVVDDVGVARRRSPRVACTG